MALVYVAKSATGTGGDADQATFVSLADANRDEFGSAIITSASVAQECGITCEQGTKVVMYRALDEPFEVSYVENDEEKKEKQINKERLAQWLLHERYPLLGMIGPNNAKRYLNREDLPLCWVAMKAKSAGADKDSNDQSKDADKAAAAGGGGAEDEKDEKAESDKEDMVARLKEQVIKPLRGQVLFVGLDVIEFKAQVRIILC